ncbi:MAG: lytic transglycosylase F, partial [Bacteroidota bacterium]
HTHPSMESSTSGVSPTHRSEPRGRNSALLFVVLVLFLSILSCTQSDRTESEEQQETAGLQPDSILVDLFPERARFTADLDSMVARGAVRILVPYSNTFYFLDGARQRGLIYEYMKGFESYLRKKLRRRSRPVYVVFYPVRRRDLLGFLLEGYGDVAPGVLTITEERKKFVDFCTPLDNNVNEIVVTRKGVDPPATPEDLAGKEVYIRKSSSYFEHLQILNDSFSQRGLTPIILREADESLETEDILEMVNAGVVPMTVADDYIAEFWSGVFDSLAVHPEIIVNAGGSIAPAVRKENPKLRELLSSYIQENTKGTLLANVLLQRYLRDNRWVKNPTAGQERAKLEKTLPLFKKYGERYNFDYVFLTALAYQESRLVQNLRSHAGAVGVMQVIPSTAAAPPINIKNIQNLENNIHAGVKYLDHIIETYLSKDELPRREEAIFAAASYNAGPTRIARLRKKAEAMGYNPNEWFGQVEVVVAREVGQETVQYVANIVKYYIAFKMFIERFAEREEAVQTSRNRSEIDENNR